MQPAILDTMMVLKRDSLYSLIKNLSWANDIKEW